VVQGAVGDVTISGRTTADDAMMYWPVSTEVESVSRSRRRGAPHATRSLTDGRCPTGRARRRLESRRASRRVIERASPGRAGQGDHLVGGTAASPSATTLQRLLVTGRRVMSGNLARSHVLSI